VGDSQDEHAGGLNAINEMIGKPAERDAPIPMREHAASARVLKEKAEGAVEFGEKVGAQPSGLAFVIDRDLGELLIGEGVEFSGAQ
jgi:hypothetical protein